MRLLLTRAAEDAARTRIKLEQAGHDVIVSPVIAMRATGAAWPRGVIDAVIATSAQAFVHLGDMPSAAVRHLVPLFLVGERTERAARSAGFRGTATVAENAANLIPRIVGSLAARNQLLYLAGVDRKTELEDGLSREGATPLIAEVYEAVAATALSSDAIAGFTDHSVDGVLHFSRRSATLFASLAERANLTIAALPHFCLSDDVAVPLRSAGCTRLHIASAPTEAALLACLTPD